MDTARWVVLRGLWTVLVCSSLVVTVHAAPPPPDADLDVQVFPAHPVVERSGGQQHLSFEFRLEAVVRPVRLMHVQVRTFAADGGLGSLRMVYPVNHANDFSDVALFEGDQFLGSTRFDIGGVIPAGGRVLFFNPCHTFGLEQALNRLSYTFYFVDDRGRMGSRTVPVEPIPAHPSVPLRLPVLGKWLVLDGHGHGSHHRRVFTAINAYRHAYDLVALNFQDSFYNGEGTRLEDYPGYGAEVIAPAGGTVAARENTLPDNPIGAGDDRQPTGNHVVIDHGNGFSSVLAHLMSGSVTVNVGDTVVPGQVLGKVGNSGASDLPHLHFHLQRGTTLAIHSAPGVPALFTDYKHVVGKQARAVELGAPASGDILLGEKVMPPAQDKQASPGKGARTRKK